MKNSWLRLGSAVSLMMTTTLMACGAGDMGQPDVAEEEEYSEEIELGSVGQAQHSCATPDGTNAVMAALAVAAAQDLQRWRAGQDFVILGDRIGLASGTGTDGKPKGSSRCGGSCRHIEPLLALQNDNATGVYVQAESSTVKVLVNPGALRSRMVAKLQEQIAKDRSAADGNLNEAPKTGFTLTNAGTASLGGCGPHFKFNVAFDSGSSSATGGTYPYPYPYPYPYGYYPPPPTSTSTSAPKAAQLKWTLSFADQANGWVDFRDLGNNVVAIDPTYGLNEGSTTTAGSCEVACTKVSPSADVSNMCCSCGGLQKAFKRSAFSTSLFLCQ